MKKFPLIVDVETQHTFREFPNPKDLLVSVAVAYDYRDGKIKSFTEKNINSIFSLLESASYIIGYNSNNFDIPVLQHYYPGDMARFHAFDILDDIKEKIGHRISLNDVVYATLNKKKSGHGLHAIELFREGKIEELTSYCVDDVKLTQELFEYGLNNKQIFYLNEHGKIPIKVDWKKYLEEEKGGDMPLTLPF